MLLFHKGHMTIHETKPTVFLDGSSKVAAAYAQTYHHYLATIAYIASILLSDSDKETFYETTPHISFR